MTSPRKSGFVLPVAVTLAVLLGLYVGAYYAMVEPQINLPGYRGYTVIERTIEPNYWGKLPVGFDPNGALKAFFTPVHWLDRRIRPHVWEPSP
jgi:hypothetical protein